MKIPILRVVYLLTFFLLACSSKDEWQPSEKEQKMLLDSLVKISTEKIYPRTKFSNVQLWWDHPEVAILHFDATSSRFNSPQADSLRYSATSIFILSENGWEFKRSFGDVNRK